jgi:hypothetical protein
MRTQGRSASVRFPAGRRGRKIGRGAGFVLESQWGDKIENAATAIAGSADRRVLRRN